MARAKQVSKRKRSTKALPVWGAAGMSLAMVGGASATGVAPAEKGSTQRTLPVITLGEEELSDVSLSKFFVFDRQRTSPRLVDRYAQMGGCGMGGGGCGMGGGGGGCGMSGGGGGCGMSGGCGGGGRGCAAGRCGGRCGGGCAVARCGGCGVGIACARCTCSCCLSWGRCQIC
jgi:hypothetical protein